MPKMFYDAEGYAASVKDERYARRLVMDADSEARRFVTLYREAQEKNDQKLYEQANDSRRTVVIEQARLVAEHAELPLASHGLVLEAGDRIRRLLEEFPAFPDPRADDVIARETYARKLTLDGGIVHDDEVPPLQPFVLSQADGSIPMQNPLRPLEADALPLMGRDGNPIPSVVGGGEFDAEDGNEDLAVIHRSISEIIAEALNGSVVTNTAGARGEATSRIGAPSRTAIPSCVIPPSSQRNVTSFTDAQLGPGVKKKRNRKKPPQVLSAASLGAVGGAHAVRTSEATCPPQPPPLRISVVVDPSKSLAEGQRGVMRSKCDRFMQRCQEKVVFDVKNGGRGRVRR